MSTRKRLVAIFCAVITLAVFGTLKGTQASSVSVSAIIDVNCGNGIRNLSEACDGADLGSASCVSLGFAAGTLTCSASCNFDTSACANPPGAPPSPPPSSGGGGGGGGGGAGAPIPSTGVVFVGRAYPQSSVTLLKDSSVVASTIAGADSKFQISLAGLSGGTYIFSLYSEDDAGNRSAPSTFPINLTTGTTVSVGDVFISPTISVDKERVRKGDVINIFGKAAPESNIVITVHSNDPLALKTTAGKDGGYSYSLDTDSIEIGSHLAKSRASVEGEVSPFGRAVSFTVGSENVLAKKTSSTATDINHDGKVNIIDFSIMAYWYKRAAPPKNVDLNNDGKVDLVDFSILAFHWTG